MPSNLSRFAKIAMIVAGVEKDSTFYLIKIVKFRRAYFVLFIMSQDEWGVPSSVKGPSVQ